MKVGERQQQGRTGDNIREVCPACKTHYLKPFFSYDVMEIDWIKKRKWVKWGKYCPNKLCTFSRKDKEELK